MSLLLSPEDLARALSGLEGVHASPDGTLVIALRAPGFAAAARLVARVVEEAERAQHHPDIDLRWRTAIFTLSTHSAGGVTRLDVELAERILAAAREVGAEPRPAPERLEIAVDCVDVATVRAVWAAALGYVEGPHAEATPNGERDGAAREGVARDEDWNTDLRDPFARGPLVWFQRMDPPRTGRNRLHIDVHVPDVATARGRVEAVVRAGGRLVTDGHAPSFWVVADPEGNELCLCPTDVTGSETP